MEKQMNAIDKLSWHWRNESDSLTLNRYEIDSLFHHIRDLKDENNQLNDDINDYEKKINQLNETIDELNKKIHDMEVKYNQLWHEV